MDEDSCIVHRVTSYAGVDASDELEDATVSFECLVGAGSGDEFLAAFEPKTLNIFFLFHHRIRPLLIMRVRNPIYLLCEAMTIV